MIFQGISVQRNGRAEDSRPRIEFFGRWLPEMGFVPGALVQVIPSEGELVFNLCNENIGSYSELYYATKSRGGSLGRAGIFDERKLNCPVFITTGNHIHKSGFNKGDELVAMCEYGCIRVRRVSGDVRLINVARTKKPRTGEPVPMVFLLGDWLDGRGFKRDTLVTVDTKPGCITLTARGDLIVYSDVVKLARKNRLKLIQVSFKEGHPLISIQGSCAADAGFEIGGLFVCDYEPGIIKLQKPEPGRFGF
jgi:hypothetical protein